MRALTTLDTSPIRMSDIRPAVYIVDDDISVQESLEAMLRDAGFRPEVFASAEEFLAHRRQYGPGCLILDVSLPDLNGLELQRRMGTDQAALPIVFITGHGNIPMSVRAMKAGATEFLTKPFDPDSMLQAIGSAIERSRVSLAEQLESKVIRDRYESLSAREREVMSLVIRGLLNKQVGASLGISEITVKAHRGRMMRKMKANSLADLVIMATHLRQPGAQESVTG
jgi:FixJ family two-component response regulator